MSGSRDRERFEGEGVKRSQDGPDCHRKEVEVVGVARIDVRGGTRSDQLTSSQLDPEKSEVIEDGEVEGIVERADLESERGEAGVR